MAKKDLRKLKRLELLDMMIEQGKQLDEVTVRNAELEARAQRLEVQVQAYEDRVGHLKDQIRDAAAKNDRLQELARSARQDSEKAAQDLKALRRENAVLSSKLEDAMRQLQERSGLDLPGLGNSDREALAALAKRMEGVIAADKERTARLEAIIESQQDLIDDLTAKNPPVRVGDAFPSMSPYLREAEPEPRGFHLGPLGKKKKKKKNK